MLVCMLFVTSAQFEYAVQLKIRFGKGSTVICGYSDGFKLLQNLN